MTQDKNNSIGDPAAISFSDDTQHERSGVEEEDGVVDAAKYFTEEEEDPEGEDGPWEEDIQQESKPQTPPFYRRPIFFIVLLIAAVLVISLAVSLSKQKKRKTVSFGDDQQFAQTAPAPPIDAPPALQSPPVASTPEQDGPLGSGIEAVAVEGPQSVVPVDAAVASNPSDLTTSLPTAPSTGVSGVPAPGASQGETGVDSNELAAILKRMKAEMSALSLKNLALQRELRQLTIKVDRITKGGAPGSSLSSQKTTPELTAVAVQPAPVNPLGAFSIKAIRKGQAWIASPGGTYTVNVGDLLPGNIRVTGIDPDNLEVATSAGVIHRKK